MTYLDLLEDTPAEAGAAVVGGKVPPPSPTLAIATPAPVEVSKSEDLMAQERIRNIEDSLYEKATTVVVDALHFPEVGEAVPQEWIDEMGEKGATARHKTASMALLPSSEAPVGLKLAAAVQASITKARATEKSGPRVLNMTLVQMPGANVTFEEMKVKR